MPALENASLILDVLADSGEPVAFSQLAARSRLPKSSLHNLCGDLVRTGLIERLPDGRYRLGLRLVELARGRLAATDVVSRFMEACSTADSVPDETAVLSVLDGSDALYLACRHGNRPIAVRYQIGMRLPAAFTATGKCLLAARSDAEISELIGSDIVRNPHTGATKYVDDLLRDLAVVRELDYSVDDEDTAPGMICFGAPVYGVDHSHAEAAIGISLVKATVSAERHGELISSVKSLAESMNRRVRTP